MILEIPRKIRFIKNRTVAVKDIFITYEYNLCAQIEMLKIKTNFMFFDIYFIYIIFFPEDRK